MPRKSKGFNKVVSKLYKTARQANKWNILTSLDLDRITNHYKNVEIGKFLGREKVWKAPRWMK